MNRKLTSLNIASNGFGVVGAQRIAEALLSDLETNRPLASITFSGDSPGCLPVTMSTCMGCGLGGQPVTTNMSADFACHHIGDSGAVILAAFLPRCAQLLFLDVSDNAIGDLGARSIMSVLMKMDTCLRSINISQNDLICGPGANFVASMQQGILNGAVPTIVRGGSNADVGCGGGGSSDSYKAQLVQVYSQFNPMKIDEIDAIMGVYAARGQGGMDQMILDVTAKYGSVIDVEEFNRVQSLNPSSGGATVAPPPAMAECASVLLEHETAEYLAAQLPDAAVEEGQDSVSQRSAPPPAMAMGDRQGGSAAACVAAKSPAEHKAAEAAPGAEAAPAASTSKFDDADY
jgi:hypothetical protein